MKAENTVVTEIQVELLLSNTLKPFPNSAGTTQLSFHTNNKIHYGILSQKEAMNETELKDELFQRAQ